MSQPDSTQEELKSMVEQLEYEVELLAQAIHSNDTTFSEEESEMIARSELDQIGSLVESMSEKVGDGPAISVSTMHIEDNE